MGQGMKQRRSGHSRRGTAEIETLLVIPILLFLLMLVAAEAKLGTSRLSTVFSANEMAYRDATAARSPAYAPNSELDPVAGIGVVKPGLPERMHVADASSAVAMNLFGDSKTVNLKSSAAYASPAWAFSAWPAEGDAQATENWFTDYANEVRQNVQDPLELSNPWTP